MPEEIKPVNQKGYMKPIDPAFPRLGSGASSNRNLDAYDMLQMRLDSANKPLSDFTMISGTALPGTGRYEKIFPGEDMEEIYGQGQGWASKMVNGVGKGLALTGTTLLQNTVGLVNGIIQASSDGRFASFYDNDFNRKLDEGNKRLEDLLPNYYTFKEKNADWYSPDKLFTANFLWDGIVKNLGFAAGAYLSGGIYSGVIAETSAALRAIPGAARLVSVGKSAEALAATEEALAATGRASEAFGKIKGLSDKFLGQYKFLNKGQQALVAGLSTTGEAGFEAYQNLNQFRDSAIQKYKDEHGGIAPTGQDLEKINRAADSVGNSSFALNTMLLTATNYIQFPKILGSTYNMEKGMINGLTKEINDIGKNVAGEYIETSATKGFGKLLSKSKGMGGYLFSGSEAFEEGAQYAIQVGTEDYYNKKYRGGSADFVDSLMTAVEQTIGTNEGMENVLIGGLSGALMMARGRYTERAEKEKNTKAALDAFNKSKLSDFTKQTIDSVSRGIAIQEDRETALKNGDKQESKDLEADYIINYLTPRITFGRFDLVRSDIEDYRMQASSEEGFAQLKADGVALPGDTRESFTARLNGFERVADNIKSLHQSLNIRYGNVLTPDGKPAYSQEVMNKMIYAASKVADYDYRIPQVAQDLLGLGIDTDSVINEVKDGKDDQLKAALAAIDEKASKKEINDDQRDEYKQALMDISEMTLRRSKFMDEYNDIKKNPQVYKDAEVEETSPTTSTGTKEVIKVKTKDGEKEFEVGENYVAGFKEMETEEGVMIPKFSEFQVLGKNEKGNIIIKTSDGKKLSLKPEVFENYILAKSSEMDPSVRFFVDNADKIFNFKFKGGKEVKGRITYDKATKTLYFESLETKKNGKPMHKIPVTRDQFVAKEGFTRAQIWSDSKFSPKTEAILSEPKTEEEVAAERDIESRINKRRAVIKELSDSTNERLEKVNNKIVSKKEELKKLNDEIEELAQFRVKDKYSNVSIVTNFNKILSRSMKGLSKLTSLRNSLENEIGELEAEKAELESNLMYFDEFIASLREQPEDFMELLVEMEADVNGIKDLVKATGNQINQFSNLIDSINDTIKDLVSLLKSSLQKFDKDYPDYIQNNFNEMMNNPLYEKVVELREYIADYSLLQDVKKEISVSEDKINEIREKIANLYKQIDEIEKEQRAKELILKKFEETLNKFLNQKAEEDAIKRNEALKKEFLGTNSNDVQNNVDESKTYQPEAKKDDLEVVGSTIAASYKDAEKPFNQRVNRFGVKFHSLENKNSIRGIIVTANTEGQILPGLTAKLVEGTNIPTDGIIALVMVQYNEDGTYSLVDENGVPIPEGENALDKAIFQVFPESKLTASYNGETQTMFRDTTPENVEKSLREQYKAWREARLKETTLGQPQSITASFGIPKYVTYLNSGGIEETDHDARTSAEDAGLLSLGALNEDSVVMVATTNDAVSNGSVTFKTPLGRVFLKVPGGLVKLFNQKFTKAKANIIFDVIHQLSKNAVTDKTVKTEKSQRLIDWLKSTVYWGIPKNTQTGERKESAGYNSIWFEETTDENGQSYVKLFMSGKGQGFEFTPTSLEDNKDIILSLLTQMYHNTNATMVNQRAFNQPYFEIVGIDKDGEPITQRWNNYQTYLLSNKSFDGKKRSTEDIPLATKLRPIKEEGDVNRSGVYFTLDSTPDDFVIPQPVPVVAPPVQTTPVVTAQPVTQPTQQPVVADGFTLDGEKPNDITLGDFGTATFKLNAKIFNEIVDSIEASTGRPFSITDAEHSVMLQQELQSRKAFSFEIPSDMEQKLMDAKNISKEVAQSRIAVSILNKVLPAARSLKQAPVVQPVTQVAPTVTPVTQPTATVSDVAKKAETKETYVTRRKDEIFKQLKDKYPTLITGDTINPMIVQPKYMSAEDIELAQKVLDPKILELEYDAEIAALEGAKPATASAFRNRPKGNAPDNEVYRMELVKQAKRFEGEDWNKFEQWLKANFPNIPVYRVKNVIKATNGKQAWGMLRDGAIYIYENAEVGTGYHEVFEAVWKMFTDSTERQAVLDEFRGRKGSYEDAFTGETIEYSKATDAQIKEQLAEEFRDYILTGKIPAKPTTGKPFILKLFSDLVNFIKEFFTGNKAQTNTANLFKKIGSGYYKEYIPYETQLSYAKAGVIDIEDAVPTSDTEFRFKIENIPSVQVHEIMQQMTYSTLADLTRNNKSLFSIPKLSKKALYAKLKQEVLGLVGYQGDLIEMAIEKKELTEKEAENKYNAIEQLYNNIDSQWDRIVDKHEEYLRAYSIGFDENDDIVVNGEDRTGREDWVDARKIDAFRKANSAIKLLFATLPVTSASSEGPVIRRSTIGGVTLNPADKVFITLKRKLFDSVNMDQMLSRLREMALNNPDYQALYKRLTKQSPITPGIDYSKLENEYDWQLMSAFWKAMKGQNPMVKTVFILPSGEVVVGDTNLSSAAAQSKYEFFNNFVATIRTDNNPYVTYDKVAKTYSVNTNINNVKLNPSKIETYIDFLNKVGIEFNVSNLRKLTDNQRNTFMKAVEGIQESISTYDKLANLTKQTLRIDGRLMELGSIKAILENPEFESTYFNLNGERVQTYIGSNAMSNLHDVISKLNNVSQLSGTKYAYLLTDAFTKGKGSLVLRRMFNIDDGTGRRKANTEDILHTAYVDGTVDESTGKRKESSQLTSRQRFIQEINLNLQGFYLNLVPGDASIEHMVKLHSADNPFISEKTLKEGYGEVQDIFKQYFISEIELSRDDRTIVELEGRSNKDLRFFKSILGETLHNEIVAFSEKNKNISAEEIYEKHYKRNIESAVKSFLEAESNETKETLENYGIITYTAEGIEVEDISFAEDKDLTEEDLDRNLRALTINYMIANIEFHKIMYSDPYQYKDELKRVKSFNSPRQSMLAGSQKVNSVLNNVYNKGYSSEDVGYTDMNRDYFRTSVIEDVFSVNDLKGYEKPFEETDGGGYISMRANRVFRIRTGNWNDAEEDQYRYDVAYYKMVKDPSLLTKEEMKRWDIKDPKKDFEKFLKKNPAVRSAYTTIKPIVSGSKEDGENFNDVVLDKFALMPMSFRVMHQLDPQSNAVKFIEKMMADDVDYAVYGTGRKVGAGEATPLYKEGGEFNDESFKEVNNIPFTIMGLQTEVPSKEDEIVTQGSQVTKLVTMDFMEAGVPIDFEPGGDINERYAKWITLSEKEKEKSKLYKEIKNNQKLLEERIKEGFSTLLDKLGIQETKDGFKLNNVNKLVTTLYDEIVKRQVNDNITLALQGFEDGHVVLEATPVYQQIRNILFSIADRNVVSPKITGGMKVQVPSTLLEKSRIKKEGKNAYTSDILKFYEDEDGKRVCEIMIGRWFESDMTDEELLKYLNKPENQSILKGIAFRTPNQKQNSTDVFKVAKLLPKEFGDNVVVPSALVKKAGSDFDIDKLSIYLKNVYMSKGEIKQIPFLGYGEEAKKKFEKMYDDGEFLTTKQLQELDRIITEERDVLSDDSPEAKLLVSIFSESLTEESITRDFVKTITKDDVKKAYINRIYKQSLENAYVESLENLVSHPLNFENLVKPNSADQLKNLTKEIMNEIGGKQFDYSSVGSMLNRTYMSSLRHAFVRGKYAIGIAAVGQTNHAQNQRAPIVIDMDRMNLVDPTDKRWIGDGQVKFEEYNSLVVNGKKKPTLSMIKDANENPKKRNFISDIIGQFIDGYVDVAKGPWIMQLGATPNVASTWLFLAKLGVPIKTIGYFMNQPIVKQYLQNLENAGYTWLFNDTAVNFVDSLYETKPIHPEEFDKMLSEFKIPNDEGLKEMLGKKIGNLSDVEKLNQRFILREFLKYSKMAEHLFLVTQGSNFDTATVNDPFILFKKQMQLKKAQNTIISSVDNILENSFIGFLKDTMLKVRDAFSEILISDRESEDPTFTSTRDVLEATLTPYVNTNDRDFIRIAQKAVADLFDWAVQTDRKINTQVKNILLAKDEKSVAKEIIDFAKKVKDDESHPLFNNLIINSLRLVPSSKEGTPENLDILGKSNKVYDQNQIIFGFNELKKNMTGEDAQLYGKLIRLAVLQSGITNSPIAFTNLIPYDDFVEIYNQTLSVIDKMPNLADYYKLGVFQRNNWNNPDIVPFMKSKLIQSKKDKMWYNLNSDFVQNKLKTAVSKGEIPKVINVSVFSGEGKSDFIVYSWETKITKAERARRKKVGDTSHVNKGLFRKVYGANGKPLVQVSEDGKYQNYVYKAVNAWGYSYKANEFYGKLFPADASSTLGQPSVIDNGFMKVSTEVEDSKIETIFEGNAPKAITTTAAVSAKIEFDKLPTRSATPTMTYAGIGSRQTHPEILAEMTRIAKLLETKGYTLNTGVTFGGKEEGADAAFSRGATKKNLFAPENQGSRTREQTIAKEIHPNPDALVKVENGIKKDGALKLMARNTNQIFGNNLDTPVDFVLFHAKETKGIRPEGGTGQAVEMARRKGIPTINMMDSNWEEQLNAVLSGKSQPTQITFSPEKQARLDELENKIKTVGIGPSESRELDELRREMAKIIKSTCKPKA